MQIDLAVDLVREQARRVVVDGDRGLIAGGFEGQDALVYRVGRLRRPRGFAFVFDFQRGRL
jgi:hypothetical protein